MSDNNLEEISKKLNELIRLQESVRDLLILNLSQTNAPHQNIARAAGIQTSRLYKIIPKGKKHSKNKVK
mgnify:CR=1 FL=1